MPLWNDNRWLLRCAIFYRGAYITALACTAIANVLGLLDPLVMKWIIDSVLPHRSLALLPWAALALFVTSSGRLLFLILSGFLAFRSAQSIMLRVRLEMLTNLLYQSAEYHDGASVGELMFRIQQDVEEIGRLASEVGLSVVRVCVSIVLIVGAMVFLNWRLALLTLPIVPAYLIFRRLYESRLKQATSQVQQESSTAGSFLQRMISAVLQLQMLRHEKSQIRRFFGIQRVLLRAEVGRKRAEYTMISVSFVLISLGIAVALGSGGYFVIRGVMSIGSLVAFYTYLVRLFDPLSTILDVDTKLQRGRVCVDRVGLILKAKPAIRDEGHGVPLPGNTPGVLEFRNVQFRYRGGREVLRDIDFTILPGQKIALVGRTGTGKSTVARLALRFYDVSAGAVCMDGSDIRALPLGNLREIISLVPQDPILLDGTIRENILMGNPKATQREVEKAVELAHLDGFLRFLPRGWDEPMGPRAGRISGGERQRIALARVFLRNPRVLVLDESTSALDSNTENKLLESLMFYGRDRSLLMISHRLPVLRWADRIL